MSRFASFRPTIETFEPRVLMASDTLGVQLQLPVEQFQTGLPTANDPIKHASLPESLVTNTVAMPSTSAPSVEDTLTGLDWAREAYGFTGTGQTVVVIDSGIAYDHPALGGGFGQGYQVVGGWDFTEENDADPYDDGPMGAHGTHVAGIIASRDPMFPGVAPGVDLISLRVFNDQGEGYFRWVEQALDWVHENRNAFDNPITTVNLSIGTDVHLNSVPQWAVLEDELAQLAADGIFISVAAGNGFRGQTSPGLSYPAASPYVVPVASVDDDGQLSDFSQRNDRVIAAPGRSIWSTVPDYVGDLDGRPDDFAALSGTSMAAPYVAGASALVREALEFVGSTIVTQETIYQWMRDTADQVFDPITGRTYRRLNIGRTLASIMPDDDYGNSPQAVYDWGSVADGDSISGMIGRLDDADYFRFTAAATGTIRLDIDANYRLDPRWDLSQLPSDNVTQGNGYIEFGVVKGQSYVIGLSTADGLGYYTINASLTATPTTIDWGRIEAERFDNIVLGPQGQSFTLVAMREAQLTIEAFFDSATADVELELFDASGNLVAKATPTTDGVRLDAAVVGGAQYELRATGSGVTVDLRATNLVRLKNSLVTVFGTDESDVFDFAAGATIHQLVVNGVGYELDASSFRTVQFYGRGGDDFITLQAADSGSRVQASAGSVKLRGEGYSAIASNVEQIIVQGGQGRDQATLYTSRGNDSVVARPDRVTIQGNDFSITVSGYEAVNTRSSGGNDRLRIYDSQGDDSLVAWNNTVRMRSSNRENVFTGFERVMVFARQGNDTAVILSQIAGRQIITPALSVVGFDQYLHRFVSSPTYTTTRGTPSSLTVAASHRSPTSDPQHDSNLPTENPSRSFHQVAGHTSAGGPPSAGVITSDSDPAEIRARLHDATLEHVSASWATLNLAERVTNDPQLTLGLHEVWSRWQQAEHDRIFDAEADSAIRPHDGSGPLDSTT